MLYKLKMAIARFMYGRYGSDNLNKALLISYIAVVLVHCVVSIFSDSVIVYLAFNILVFALFAVICFRTLSRNIYARQRENRIYLQLTGRIANRFKVISGNIRERDKKYVICPACKAVVRFPRKRGVHSAQCPKCHAKMTVKI